MKSFDLNALGVEELGKNQLMEINGGQEIPYSPTVLQFILQMGYYFFTEIVPILQKQMCERASKDGYVMYADLGHR